MEYIVLLKGHNSSHLVIKNCIFIMAKIWLLSHQIAKGLVSTNFTLGSLKIKPLLAGWAGKVDDCTRH